MKTRTIAIALPITIGHYGFYREALERAQRAAVEKGLGFWTFVPPENPAADWKAWLRSTAGLVDGFLIVSPRQDGDPCLRELAAAAERKPAVLLLCRSPQFSSVTFDNRHAVSEALRHLAGSGRKKIATITGDPGTHDGRERLEAYRAALASLGLPAPADYAVRGDFSRVSGRRGMEKLLNLEDRPTAVFCANDNMAVGALEACSAAKVAVPRDLALVGCDDDTQGNVPAVPLTTVRIPFLEMALRGVEELVRAIESGKGGEAPRETLVQGSLIVRASTDVTGKLR